MLYAVAFLSLIVADTGEPQPKAPAPCTYPLLRLAADQPDARRAGPAKSRPRDDRRPPCAILQNWSPTVSKVAPQRA